MSDTSPEQNVIPIRRQPAEWMIAAPRKIARQALNTLPATLALAGATAEQAQHIAVEAALDFVTEIMRTWDDRRIQAAAVALELTRRINAGNTAAAGDDATPSDTEVQHG